MVSLLDSWENPQYLTRIWCIFEVLTAARLEIDMKMIMPPNEVARLLSEIDKENGLQRARENIAEINVEDAQATNPQDAEKVRQRIAQTIQLSGVNRKVKECMARLFGEAFTNTLGINETQ